MTNRITLYPSQISFDQKVGETILDSAIASGFPFKYSCKKGSCGDCKVTLLSGEVESSDPYRIISEEQKKQGVILSCMSKSTGACNLEAEIIPELAGINRKVVPAKIDSIEFPVEDVAIINFRLPPNSDFKYLPGQYLNLSYLGVQRSYSIANTQDTSTGIELHIRKVPSGIMSGHVFETFKQDMLVRLDGPIGSFFVRETSRPIIFIATGTGFAPVKSMLESLLFNNSDRRIYLYWGVTSEDSYYDEKPNEWASKNSLLTFIPVVSGCNASWDGRRGLVHEAVLEDFSSLEGVDVYASGSPKMIESAWKSFSLKNLPENQFYSDAFVSSDN